MTFRPVAVLDSGIGGLPYLSWLQENLPFESLVYVADHANFPYGEKTPRQVRSFVVELGRAIVERYEPKLLLVACNTASVLALDALRGALTVPIVGVVPAVKTAAAIGTGTLGVLATPRTVENDYWENLARQYVPERRVKGYAAPELVTLVEEGASQEQREALLLSWARRLKNDGVDALVLGCTHYLHLAEDLSRHLGPGVSVIDSRDGVGRRVAGVLEDRGLLAAVRRGPDLFHFTAREDWDSTRLAPLEVRYRDWSRRFGLEYGGPWVVPVCEAQA
jgi:glutamate racemase